MEDNDKKQTLVGLLVAAVVLILAGNLLAWLGEGRKRDFEVKLLEELMASSPNSQVVKTVARGYVDDIHVWTAVEPDGKVVGVTIRSLHETPGVGRRVLRDEAFLRQFLGTRGNAEIGVNVDGISGATVTSRAVARAINDASSAVTGVDAVTEPTTWGKGGEAYE